MKILSIQVGRPRKHFTRFIGDDRPDEWRSGIFKSAVLGPVWVGKVNLDGDGQENLRVHGGPDRAVLAFSSSEVQHWEQQIGESLAPGAFGENFTVDDVDEAQACLGDIWASSGVTLQVSQPRLPCNNLSKRLGRRDFHLEVTRHGRAGWYLRVLQEGEAQVGDQFTLLERPHPDWTVERAFSVFINKEAGYYAELGSIPELSELWKSHFREK